MIKEKVIVDKLPSKPIDCKYAHFSGGTYWCSFVHWQKVCTRTVGMPCCFLAEKPKK